MQMVEFPIRVAAMLLLYAFKARFILITCNCLIALRADRIEGGVM